MKRALAGAVLVTALALAGCAQQPSEYDSEVPDESVETGPVGSLPMNFNEYTFRAADGTVVMCFTWSEFDFLEDSMKSGLSCFPKT